MGYLRELSPAFLKEWIEAIIVVIGTLVVVASHRSVLRQIEKHKNWKLAAQAEPFITNLLYLVGMRLFFIAAPIDARSRLWLEDVVYVITVWFVLLMIRRAALFAMAAATQKARTRSQIVTQGFIPIIKNLITLFLFLSGLIMTLKHFNYDVMSLVTALGVGSLAVGLAAKDALANMISGFVLIFDRNMGPGDRIRFKDITGDVQEIGLRSTLLFSSDGNSMIVPNVDLLNNTIVNLSHPSRAASCTTQIRVPYTVSFPQLKSLCLEVVKTLQKVNQDRSTWVNLVSLSDGYQLVTIGFWLNEMDDSGEVLTHFHQKLLEQLQTKNIPLIELTELDLALKV